MPQTSKPRTTTFSTLGEARNTSHLRALLILGVPIVITQLGGIVQSFADTIMVGRYGTLELSAVSFSNNIFNLVIFFLLGYSYSTTPIVGYHYGKNDIQGTAQSLKECVLCNGLLSVVITTIMLLLYQNLELLQQPEELLPLIRPYLLALIASIPFIALFNALKQFSDAVGNTRLPMWIMIAGNIVNVIGNYLLIYGVYGCPEWGLFGAGVATLISRIFMFVAILIILFVHPYYKKFIQALSVSISRHGMWHITKVGIPISCQLCLEASSFNIAAIFMGWIGANALAAHQIMCTISTLCFSIFYGIGAAAAIRISHFRGNGQQGELRKIARTAYMMTATCAIIMCTCIYLFRNPLVGAFTTSQDVICIVFTLLPAFFVYQAGDSLQIIYANALRGIEDVKMLLFYAFIAYFVIAIPLSYLFAFHLGIGAQGVWWGIPFGLTTAGILFYKRYRKGTRL